MKVVKRKHKCGKINAIKDYNEYSSYKNKCDDILSSNPLNIRAHGAWAHCYKMCRKIKVKFKGI